MAFYWFKYHTGKMKTKVVIWIALIMGIIKGHAQTAMASTEKNAHSFYFAATGGYAFGVMGLSAQSIVTSSFANTYSNHSSAKSLSLGKGIMPQFTVGLMFTPNIGLELNCSYLIGAKQTWYMLDRTDSTGTSKGSSDYTASMLQLAERLVVQGYVTEQFKPYFKIGPVIGFLANINEGSLYYATYHDANGNLVSGTFEDEYKYSGGWALGMSTTIGMEIGISAHWSFLTEATFTALSYSPVKGVHTVSKADGIDKLADMKTSEKETVYSGTIDTNELPDPNAPKKSLKSYYPFSDIGLHAGLKFTF